MIACLPTCTVTTTPTRGAQLIQDGGWNLEQSIARGYTEAYPGLSGNFLHPLTLSDDKLLLHRKAVSKKVYPHQPPSSGSSGTRTISVVFFIYFF